MSQDVLRSSLPVISYKRDLPFRTPPTWMLLSGLLSIVSLGVYLNNNNTWIRRELKREAMQARLAIQPTIIAEQDRQLMRDRYRYLLLERKVMQGVPGWRVGESTLNDKSVYIQERFPISDEALRQA